MAELSAFAYALSCTKRGKTYFPDGMRRGLFLHLDHEDEHYGTGELAPLVGIHPYNIDDLMHFLKNFSSDQLKNMFLLKKENLKDLVLFFSQFSYPLSNALSMIFFHHQIYRQVSFTKPLVLAALIEEQSPEDQVAFAHNYEAQGFSCLKIKIGSLPVDHEIKKIKTIASIVGKHVNLRLDANRQLSFHDACTLLKALKKNNIEYIEEPCHTIDQSKTLYQETGVNIAIDESLESPFYVDKLCDYGIKVVIIKPSRFHSVYHVIDCAKQALYHGIKPIFSHCFESEFSSGLYASLIHELGLFDHAHGVIAEGFFKQNVLKKPLRSFRGQLFFDAQNISPQQFWRVPCTKIL